MLSILILIFISLFIFGLLWAIKAVCPKVDTSASNIDLSSIPSSFIVFDLETTGLDATKNEILEIGAIKVNKASNCHDTFQALIKTEKRIPKKITEITGISQDMVDQDGMPLIEALGEFVAFIEDLPGPVPMHETRV